MRLKIIFCGTPEFAAPSLQALLDSRHTVIAVYTQPDRAAGRGQHLTASPVKKLALAHQLPVYQPESLREPAQRQILQNLAADLMVVVAYGLLLPKSVLSIPRYGAINVHPSLLPRWRGATPIQSAILAGDAQTGVSIIQLTPRMDAGPVLYQTHYALNAQETSGELHDLLAQQGAQALLSTLDLLTSDGWQNIKPQDERLATYTQKITKKDGQIDWRQPAAALARAVRAYHPWPVAFTHFRGAPLRIWQAQALPGAAKFPPGVLAQVEPTGLDIATGDGILRLLTVQLAGGRPLSVADFIHGQRQYLQVGANCFE